MVPRPLGPNEIDGLLVPPCKAYEYATAWPSDVQEKWFMTNHHTYKLGWLYLKNFLDVMTS